MKRMVVVVGAVALGLVCAVATSQNVGAAAGSPVVGTYSVADNGQGSWGGGNLRADGSVGGMVAFSAANGQLVAHFLPTDWYYADPSDVVICFTVQVIKGDPNAFGGSQFCAPLPITGAPVKVVNADGSTTVIRLDMRR